MNTTEPESKAEGSPPTVAMPPKEPATRPKGHRLGFLWGVLILAVGALAYILLKPELERNLKAWLTMAVVIISVALGLIWFLLLSRFAWRWRVGLAALVAVVYAAFPHMVRVDGTMNGMGLPKLAWRWAPVRAPRVAAPAPVLATGSQAPVAAPPLMLDTPQFFGPERNGVARSVKLARDWSAVPPKELWRHPVGSGWSAFAVVGGRAYTQEQLGNDEAATCYDALNGRLLWSHTNPVRFSQWQSGDGPHATPTVNGGRVYAIGATGILECLDAVSGQRIWSHETLKENKLENLTWGVSASPLIVDDMVVVTGGQTDGRTLLAYQAADGKPLWRSGTDRASYASPILTTLAGRRVVLSVNMASVTAHDPKTGEIVFDYQWPDGKLPKASQPIVFPGDRIFLSAGYGMGCIMLEVKSGADGKLAATQLWKSMRMKTQFNSAAARDGYLYGLDDGGLACVDAATGERKWKGGHFGSGQSLLMDDLAIVQSETGEVALADAKPEQFNELGRIPALKGKTWNQPTLAGRYLLVRNGEEAACYELPLREDGVAAAGK